MPIIALRRDKAEGRVHLATAVETHFWWQSLGDGMREIPRGDVQGRRFHRCVIENAPRGWLCAVGTKPI